MGGHFKQLPPLTDEQAKLVEAHYDYAIKGARAHFRRRHGKVSMEDLESAALFGLCHAATKFDHGRGCKFTTYAFDWCERYMTHAYRIELKATGCQWDGNVSGSLRRYVQRSEWPVVNDNGDLYDPPQPNPQTPDVAIELTQLKSIALRRVANPTDRDVLRACLDGESRNDIAARMNVTRSMVNFRVNRAITQARNPDAPMVDDRPAKPPMQIAAAPVTEPVAMTNPPPEPMGVNSFDLVIQDLQRKLREADDEIWKRLQDVSRLKDARAKIHAAYRALCDLTGREHETTKEQQTVTPRDKPAFGATQARIYEELAKREPQTAKMLQALITDVTTVATHCSVMGADGRLVWRKGEGRTRWYARSQAAFERWRDNERTA